MLDIYLFSFVETSRKFIIAELSIHELGSSSVLIIRLFEFTRPFLLCLPVGRGGVINSPRSVFLCFSFSFRCSKLGYRSWVIPLCILLSEPVSPRLFNSVPGKLCHQNTHFNMYTTTSKQQEGSTCKDLYPNCFIATNSAARLWRGAMKF